MARVYSPVQRRAAEKTQEKTAVKNEMTARAGREKGAATALAGGTTVHPFAPSISAARARGDPPSEACPCCGGKLAKLGETIADHPASRLHELLPWHWKTLNDQAAAA